MYVQKLTNPKFTDRLKGWEIARQHTIVYVTSYSYYKVSFF